MGLSEPGYDEEGGEQGWVDKARQRAKERHMYEQVTTEYDAEASIRIQALEIAGRHEPGPSATDQVIERAEAYLKFIKAGLDRAK